MDVSVASLRSQQISIGAHHGRTLFDTCNCTMPASHTEPPAGYMRGLGFRKLIMCRGTQFWVGRVRGSCVSQKNQMTAVTVSGTGRLVLAPQTWRYDTHDDTHALAYRTFLSGLPGIYLVLIFLHYGERAVNTLFVTGYVSTPSRFTAESLMQPCLGIISSQLPEPTSRTTLAQRTFHS